MTKIAIPVKDNTLTLVDNAGHTPKFAVFEMIGSGMFRSFKLQSIIDNPRTDLDDHDHDDEGHQCSHGHDDAEHIAQHNKMGAVLEGCSHIVVKRVCKNTVNAMKPYGIKVVKYNGNATKADMILKESAALLV